MTEIHIERPLMSVKEYAKLMNITPNAVRMKIKKGQLPVFKRGNSRPMVNMAALAKEAAEAA